MIACSDCSNRAKSISLIDSCEHSSKIGEETNGSKSWPHRPTRAQALVRANSSAPYAATIRDYMLGTMFGAKSKNEAHRRLGIRTVQGDASSIDYNTNPLNRPVPTIKNLVIDKACCAARLYKQLAFR